MFLSFYEALRDSGVPVRLTAWLVLHRALRAGLARSDLVAFYRLARAVLVKSETYFDLYDRVFARHFHGVEAPVDAEAAEELERTLREWLDDPRARALLTDQERESLSLEELLQRFEERLAEQDGRHEGGSRWVGTGGTSPFGNSGGQRRGFRLGGGAGLRSAVKVAGERRWRDYARDGAWGEGQSGEALARLKQMEPGKPGLAVDTERTIRRTVQLGGEIEIVFEREKTNRLRLILLLDNGGWSMDPWAERVGRLFVQLVDRVRELRSYYFHNCVYETLWTDPPRSKGVPTEELLGLSPEHALVILGDASMAPEELESRGGAIYRWGGDVPPGIAWLRRLAERFPRSAWLNPIPAGRWDRTYGAYTVARIGGVFRMFDLSLDGLERAVAHLNRRARR